MAWRRGYATPPPPVPRDDPSHPANDPRYVGVPAASLPGTECLRDVVVRVIPYWEGALAPEPSYSDATSSSSRTAILRGLLKYLEGVSDDEIEDIDVPTGIPRSTSSTPRSRFARPATSVTPPPRPPGGRGAPSERRLAPPPSPRHRRESVNTPFTIQKQGVLTDATTRK